MYMLFTGFPISGREAYECGLVSKVVENDKLGESPTKHNRNVIEKNIVKIKPKSNKLILTKQNYLEML